MVCATSNLGMRIVQAARLAMLVHLNHLDRENTRQQPAPGGAGNGFSREGELPLGIDRRRRSPLAEEGA